MGGRHSLHACAAQVAPARAVASSILHLAASRYIDTGPMAGSVSSTERCPAARVARDTQRLGGQLRFGPVASWNCGEFNRPPCHGGFVKGTKIRWTGLGRYAGEQGAGPGAISDTSRVVFDGGPGQSLASHTAFAQAGRPLCGTMAKLESFRESGDKDS